MRISIDDRYCDIMVALSAKDFKDMAAAILMYALTKTGPDLKKQNLMSLFDVIREDMDRKEKDSRRKKVSKASPTENAMEITMENSTEQEKKEKSPSVSLSPTPPISLSNPLEKKENSVSNSARTRKIPPSLEEVRAYCEQTGGLVDAEEWMAFYESKGWMVGKNKMTNWKSAVNTWNIARKKKLQAVTPKGYVYNYECGEDESL